MLYDIILHLIHKYKPISMILYGSFANGTNNKYSDLDALLICKEPPCPHDDSIFQDTQLDVFIYAPEQLSDLQPADLLQIYDSQILLDQNNLAADLQKKVRSYVDNFTFPSDEENHTSLSWCRKMQKRALRNDEEGFFRWHWLLTDSLSIYCNLKNWFYFGPKKTLLRMQKEDPIGWELYTDALRHMEQKPLDKWLCHMEQCFQKDGERNPSSADTSSSSDEFSLHVIQIQKLLRDLDNEPYIDDQMEIEEIWNLCNDMIQKIDFSEIALEQKKELWNGMAESDFYNAYGVYDPMHDLAYHMCTNMQEEIAFAKILERYGKNSEASVFYRKSKCHEDAIRCMKACLSKNTKQYLELINYLESLNNHAQAVETAELALSKCKDKGITDILLFLFQEAARNGDAKKMGKLKMSAERRSYANASVIRKWAEENGFPWS